MKQQALIDYIRQPQTLNLSQVEELEQLIRQFPYFQTAQLLYAKALHKNNPALFGKVLKRTAIVAASRSQLYHLIHLPEPVQQQEEMPLVVQEEEPVVVLESPVMPRVIEEAPKQEVPLVQPSKKEEEKEPVLPAYTPPMFSTVTQTGFNFDLSYLKALENREELKTAPKEEKIQEPVVEEASKLQPKVETPVTPVIPSIEPASNQDVEREIEKQIIAAFVEKELLKTPDLHKPVPQKTEAQEKIEKEHKNEIPEPPVSTQEPHSFSEWMKALNQHKLKYQDPETPLKPLEKAPVKEQTPEKPKTGPAKRDPKKEEVQAIMDKIIDANPGHIRLTPNKFYTADAKAKESLLENEHLVTETLAKIYALQGNINKAIRAYEILSLKFPQKSAYFATLIENLKKEKN